MIAMATMARTTRAILVLGVGLALGSAGCSLLPDARITLLTGNGPPEAPLGDSCYASQHTGLLVVDPTYGTRFDAPNTVPIMWRAGYTGRRLSSGEVAVLDPSGTIVATTGRTYDLGGGGFELNGSPVFYACGWVIQQ